ncbi:MAG: hypothetical protein ACLFQM_03130 [Fidelibacterota bacterium]
MDIKTRKISFIQEFLRIDNEDIVEKLEEVLHSEKKKRVEKKFEPMSAVELNSIIDQAETDSKNDRLTSAHDLKKEIDSWH